MAKSREWTDTYTKELFKEITLITIKLLEITKKMREREVVRLQKEI